MVPAKLCIRVLNAQLATKDAPANPPDVSLGLAGVKLAIRCVSNAMSLQLRQDTAERELYHCTLDIVENTMGAMADIGCRIESIIRRKCKIANADEKKARLAKGICHAAAILVGNASCAYAMRRELGQCKSLTRLRRVWY